MKKAAFFLVVFMLNNFLFSQKTAKINNNRTNLHSSLGTLKSKNKPPVNNILTDPRDGQVYKIVKIGTQVWMAENLRTTHYNNGSTIPNVTSNTTWSSVTNGAWCSYDNSTANDTKYGKLYNWYAVNTGLLAPKGWHVATVAEWTTLTTYLGGESVAGGKLKEVGTLNWNVPNIGATNETGFSALPGGLRASNGTFSSVGSYGGWWSSSEYDMSNAWRRSMSYGDSYVSGNDDYYSKQRGFSVRCVRD